MSAGKRTFIGVIVVLSAVLVRAQQLADPVLTRLSKTGIFAFGGVGFAGVTSEGEKDFRTVLDRPSALTEFEELLTKGNLQAKAYALVGIRKFDVQRYKELSAPLHEMSQQMTIQSGCVMSHAPFSAVLKRIDAGDFDSIK